MARSVNAREIVELPYMMPDGTILKHMGLVVSRPELQDDEDGLFYALLISSKNYHPEYTIEINPEWLNKPLGKQSYFVTHILQQFNVDHVLTRYNLFIKKNPFNYIVDKTIDSIFGDPE